MAIEKLSAFHHQVIEAIAGTDPKRDSLSGQLTSAELISRDYTGAGLYVHISIPAIAQKNRSNALEDRGITKEACATSMLPAGADLIVWLENGLISCLECYTYEGDCPEDESLFRVSTE